MNKKDNYKTPIDLPKTKEEVNNIEANPNNITKIISIITP